MTDCLFCKIAAGEIPAEKVYEDDQLLAFKDIQPKAPVHILLIPKVHIDSLGAAGAEHTELLGQMMLKAAQIAKEQGLNEGFRLVTNTGPGGGQEIAHLHYHILGDVRDTQWRGL